MATIDDVRAIASKLEGTTEGEEGFGFSVEVGGKHKGFLWAWSERVHPKKPKVINYGVIAVIVPNLEAKDMLIESNPVIYFTEPHYNGFPAVLVRLEAIALEELESIVVEAYRVKRSKPTPSPRRRPQIR